MLLEELMRLNPATEEARYRSREELVESRVEPPIALRLDGVGFGKALRGFEWPRDPRVHSALLEAAALLLERLSGDAAYVGSDEINLVIMGSLPYSGRVEKLVSIAAGIASAAVSRRLGRLLYFDARIVPLDDPRDAHRYLMYRCRVVLNNYVTSLLYAMDVPVERLEAGLRERIDMLRSRGVEPLAEPWKALGSCVERLPSTRKVGGSVAERRRLVAIDGPCQRYSSSNETR